ncbi:hypothetical protein LCGC14_2421800, partial [marine sediment metagenome]
GPYGYIIGVDFAHFDVIILPMPKDDPFWWDTVANGEWRGRIVVVGEWLISETATFPQPMTATFSTLCRRRLTALGALGLDAPLELVSFARLRAVFFLAIPVSSLPGMMPSTSSAVACHKDPLAEREGWNIRHPPDRFNTSPVGRISARQAYIPPQDAHGQRLLSTDGLIDKWRKSR